LVSFAFAEPLPCSRRLFEDVGVSRVCVSDPGAVCVSAVTAEVSVGSLLTPLALARLRSIIRMEEMEDRETYVVGGISTYARCG
jgi:hypothetical protein